VPVLAQLAEFDRLFPAVYADLWAAQFVLSPSVTVDVVPGTGHTYMLHHAGPAAAERIASWLATTAGLPGCVAAAAASPEVDTAAIGADPSVAGESLPATGPAPALAVPALLLLVAGLGRWVAAHPGGSPARRVYRRWP